MQSRPQKATWHSRNREPSARAGSLAERLAPLAGDRAHAAVVLVREAAAELAAWIQEQPLEWSWDQARAALDHGLARWSEEQGWRGPCARLLDVLARARAFEAQGIGPREVLIEELTLWGAGAEPGAGPWSGAPLAAGLRLVDRRAVAEHALPRRGAAKLARGERILVLAPSDLIEPALEAAWKEGLEPRVVTGEGGPHRDGLRLARRLAGAGIAVEVTYDAALARQADRADRLWLGTEATDGRAFLAPNGAEALLVRARALELEVELFATRDERLPTTRELAPPPASSRDRWLLWEHAPAGVLVLSATHECVPLGLVRHVVTESGRIAPSRLAEETRWPVDAAKERSRARPTTPRSA
jgi:hypothetical protein